MKRSSLICSALLALVTGLSVTVAVLTASPAFGGDSYTPLLSPTAVLVDRIVQTETAAYTPSARLGDRAVARVPQESTEAKNAFAKRDRGSELSRAKKILAGLITAHPILRGTTVEMGDARGYQAIAYYRSGRIVISRSHRASLERILSHEVWHVIDYRDNGRIDWGENVPR